MAEQHGDKDQQDYLIDQARAIRDEIEVPVFGPAGHTPPCAEAWPTAKLIAGLLHRIEALEAKDEDDKEAWAARLRRPGRSQAERIASLVKRIEALETAAQPAKPNHPAKPDSSLVERVRQAQGCGNERDARAAIREVAAWLREHFLQGFDPHSAGGWAMRLEQEAEHLS